jgi:hypothetical protein
MRLHETLFVLGYWVSATEVSSEALRLCRDQNLWPFDADSIWNTPIGGGAVYSPAFIFADHDPGSFFSDDDYFVTTADTDPLTDWYTQGWYVLTRKSEITFLQ